MTKADEAHDPPDLNAAYRRRAHRPRTAVVMTAARELELAHEALGQAIRLARRAAGLSQTLLAQRSRVSRTQLSVIERGAGQNPSLLAISRLAYASDVSVETFVVAFVRGSNALVPIRASDAEASVAGAKPLPDGDARAMGTVLRALRSDHALNVTQLADRAGMGLKHVMDLEYGRVKRPGLSTLFRLAVAIGAHREPREVVRRRMALLARVYAGELRADLAIRHSRAGLGQACTGFDRSVDPEH